MIQKSALRFSLVRCETVGSSQIFCLKQKQRQRRGAKCLLWKSPTFHGQINYESKLSAEKYGISAKNWTPVVHINLFSPNIVRDPVISVISPIFTILCVEWVPRDSKKKYGEFLRPMKPDDAAQFTIDETMKLERFQLYFSGEFHRFPASEAP